MDFLFKQLDIHVANHCNLNCKSCMHFSPIAEEWFLTPEDLRSTLDSINKDILDNFERVSLLGGEPLLSDNLVEIMDVTREFFTNSNVVVHTNGLLLMEMGDEFWDACLRNNISIIVSKNNPSGLDYAQIEEFVNGKGVEVQIMPITFIKYPLDLNGEQDSVESFLNCTVRPYHLENMQLVGNKLYQCPFAAYRTIFNDKFGTNLEGDERDYIELGEETTIDDVMIWKETPKNFCKYCKSTLSEPIEWGFSEKTIDEWS